MVRAMHEIAIVTDRGCDLSAELLRSHDVTVVPLIVRFGDEVVMDDGSLSPDAFWDRVAAGPPFPETSQPSPGMFEEAFAPLIAAGRHVLCPLISGRLSGTINAAHVAAQRFPGKITLVDTRSLSVGQALQVLLAARAARQGLATDAIVRLLESVRQRCHLFMLLDTVDYLRRGGRAAALLPILKRVVRALRVKVLLRLEGGELQLMTAVRSRAKGVRRIVDEVTSVGPVEALATAHTRRPAESAELAATLAQRLGLPQEALLVAEAGPALSSHAGPGVIAAAVLGRAT
jgi:DegV family protein with EDD domain